MENGWESIEAEHRQRIINKLITDKTFSLIAVSELSELSSGCDRTVRIAEGKII
jgi:hypothetical protein